MSSRNIVLEHRRAPGDIVVLTALVRDIALTHPGKFNIGVHTSAMDIWKNNPFITQLPNWQRRKDVETIKIQYGHGIREQKDRAIHFLAAFHEDFFKQTKIRVPLTLPYPDLHLSPEEKTPIFDGKYWCLLSGGKSDFTSKVWATSYFQELVYKLRDVGLNVIQLGSNEKGHWHPPLAGVTDLVGKTSLRDMIRLIQYSEGVICGITCAMHVAAALHRPCVVLAGGREAWWWEAYVRQNKGFFGVESRLPVPHRYLHTIGALDCCKYCGCWKNKTVKINNDQSICKYPVKNEEQDIPLCMDMITPETVFNAVMSYYIDNTLPPIDVPYKYRDHKALFKPTEVTEEAKEQYKETTPRLLNLFDDQKKPKTKAEEVKIEKISPTQAKLIVPKDKKLEFLAGAKLEGRGKNELKPAAVLPIANLKAVDAVKDENIINHPDIGGKVSVFAFLQGGDRYYDLHSRCLQSIIKTIPNDKMDFIVGSVGLERKSTSLIDKYMQENKIVKHYQHMDETYKFQIMREMFNDPALPIKNKWILWFDDTAVADKHPKWFWFLAQTIVEHYKPGNAHMFGVKYIWNLQPKQKEWFEVRPWYKHKLWRDNQGNGSPNGDKILFCVGDWFCLSTEAMRKCNIPDPELLDNGGDYVIGEQLYHGGYNIKVFNTKQQYITFTKLSPPRPIKNKMPGA